MTKLKDGLKSIETNAADPKKHPQCLSGMLDLEAAVLDGDAEKIKAACDKVNSAKNAGHSKFNPRN